MNVNRYKYYYNYCYCYYYYVNGHCLRSWSLTSGHTQAFPPHTCTYIHIPPLCKTEITEIIKYKII